MAKASHSEADAPSFAANSDAESGNLHVAIIMDGNGRWAQKRHLPRAFGHKAGVDALRRTVEAAPNLGIKYLTVYAFSTENWQRPNDEVEALLNLLAQFVASDLERLYKNNVKIIIQGKREGLNSETLKLIEESEEKTKNNKALNLIICFNYGGQTEIAQAAKSLAKDVKDGKLAIEQINEKTFAEYIPSNNWPYPDLIIRTAGEKRLSNFLMWQSAYSELVFLDILWPDFKGEDLLSALGEFNKRNRRFGGI